MTQEDRELILKDLCGRLPYFPIAQISLFRNDRKRVDIELDPHVSENLGEIVDKYHANLYLRPMSSMTEEEYKELRKISDYYGFPQYDFISNWCPNYEIVDWLNKKMFDYRGLIEKGLAIEVTEENNPYKY